MIPPNLYRDVPMATNYLPIVSGIAFGVAWFLREYQYGIERERLLDRIMSKDVREFKAITEKRKIEPQAWGQYDDETLAVMEDKRKAQILAGE